MKLIALLLLLLSACGFAAEKGTPGKTASKKAAQPAPQVTIPKEAVQVDSVTYRYTDAQGKRWLFRRTPFGIAKIEETPPAPSAAERNSRKWLIDSTRAVEHGDEVQFERPGPFGLYRWQKRKTELNEVERAAWERSRTQSQAKKE